ncbi:hypothetical protein GQ44DRAFT_287252 [Phaeosphaeriaceae sp. PMI808]|nr:hypothetical protein GQ44DRAFT_287252 [Phaeosphaeriaceae sp. PMI808]
MPSEVGEDSFDLFQEPEGFYEPEKQPTIASHQLLSGQELSVQLVGHNPLWVSKFLNLFLQSPKPCPSSSLSCCVLRISIACSRNLS